MVWIGVTLKLMPNNIWKSPVLQSWVQKEQQNVETLVLRGRSKERDGYREEHQQFSHSILCLKIPSTLIWYGPMSQHIPKKEKHLSLQRLKTETKPHTNLLNTFLASKNNCNLFKWSNKKKSWTKHFHCPFPWWPPCASLYVSRTQLASWFHWPPCR